MRFGLIGDVHAEDERLHLALTTLINVGVDRLLCVGDVVDGEGNLDRVCALLLEHHVTTVRGNHDRWIATGELRSLPHSHHLASLAPKSIAFLESLTPTVSIDLRHGRLLLCHGVGTDDMARLGVDDQGYALATNDGLQQALADETLALMVCGHTHRPMVRAFERGRGLTPLVVVNAGTLARHAEPGFALLDTEAKQVDFYRIEDDLSCSAPQRKTLE